MSSPQQDDQSTSCLASGRSRRQKRENTGRAAALEKLKRRERNKYEVTEDTDDVYDLVDEREYSRRVQERLEDNWIVDDGAGEYVEDGREIFDDDIVDDGSGGRDKRRKVAKRVRDPAQPKKNNLRDMLLQMPSKKVKRDAKLDEDEDLQSIIQGIRSSPALTSLPAAAAVTQLQRKSTHKPAPKKISLPQALTPKTPRAEALVSKKPLPARSSHPLRNLTSEVCNKDTPTEDSPSQTIEDEAITQQLQSEREAERRALEDMIEDNDSMFDDISAVDTEAPLSPAEVTLEHKEVDSSAVVTSEWSRTTQLCQDTTAADTPVVVDSSSLPLVDTDNGDKVFRFYWLDAYADHMVNPGVAYLFGRVKLPAESSDTHVTCCVRLDNIPRRVFLLPRVKRLNLRTREEGDDVTLKDVYDEFSASIATRFKISEFRSKVSSKKYAFERTGVPDEAEYLEVMYSSSYRALPQNLEGETFSHVFGSNTNTLEQLLLAGRVRGPCWMDVQQPQRPRSKLSFCAVEVSASWPQPALVSLTQSPPPPLTVLTVSTRTVVSPRHHQSELVLLSCLVHRQFRLDRPAPAPVFQEHFCALTRPGEATWPFDFDKQLNNFTATSVRKCVNEKALISFFLAKMNKLDPDVVVGHNVYGFDLDILISRCRLLKLNNWAHLGRLRRSADVLFKSKMSDEWLKRSALCGRLLCDSFLSAKELTRQKNYELPELCRTVLHLPASEIVELTQEKVASMFNSSKTMLELVTLTMQDAHNSMRIVAELNALPLAMQITCLAGNLMSRTLLGGRAERNEFLLLHAFTERGYVTPDKQYGKKKTMLDASAVTDGDDVNEQTADKRSRRKPKYGGGLVLDPKKGFYDQYILLMDFNSLYPSIIQEYNICFTTLPRLSPASSQGQDEDDVLLDLPDSSLETGVLPFEIKKLVERRREVKKLMKDATLSAEERTQLDVRQKALKLTANSMYGCLGFDSSRFYAKHLAALITAKGRDILMQTKSLVEKMDLEVIYGDTDSIMINSRQLNYDKVMELGKEIKREVNKLYRLLELDVDGLYRYMLLLKKKKYAAVVASRGADGVIGFSRELKGLDIVRRDWCQLAADCGIHVIEQIFSGLNHDEKLEKIHSHLESVRDRLNNGQVSLAELSITKELKKNPDEYADKKGQAHVNVALRVNSRSGKKLRRGDTVQYIICKDGSSLEAMQRAYSVDEVRSSSTAAASSDTSSSTSSPSLSVDVDYYLANQLHPVVSRLLEPIECTDSARVAECLGLDASKYRHHIHQGGMGDNTAAEDVQLGRTMRSAARRFATCKPLQVHCVGCRQNQSFSAPLIDGSGEPRLARCETPACDTPPLQYLPLIANQLRVQTRRVIHEYLQGVLYCEDPCCTNETRAMPFLFEGGYPVCDSCHKALLIPKYDDRSLYNQISYFQHAFDLKTAMEAADAKQKQNVRRRADFPALETAYSDLYKQVESTLGLSSYCHVNLDLLFRDMALRPAIKPEPGQTT